MSCLKSFRSGVRAAGRLCPLVPRPRHATRTYATVSASELQFGQPVHETHPHILKAGEITPGITAQEYWDRRARLARQLPVGGVAILPSADLKYRSGAVFHAFRQESNFLYLTGWNEADSLAIIQNTGEEWGDYTFQLYCLPKNPTAEQWGGPRNGVRAAEDIFNADLAADIASIPSVLPKILSKATRVYADFDTPDARTSGVWSRLKADTSSWWPSSRLALYPLLNNLRAIKSPAEIANMRRAGQISGRVITEAMRRAWTKEKDLHNFLDYRFIADGCDGPAYIPVVGGGRNGMCIHYVLNNDVLHDGELVLVDAGGEYGTYITDISRTWPVNGRFTPAQRDLYQAVLTVQRRGVSLCREDANVTLDDIHHQTTSGLHEELKALGFDVNSRDVDRLFPHHVGHYVGLDVHDVPGYGRRTPLKSGHCVTIEPGLYIPDEERWPKHFRGLGVRIEDSVCVDETSPFIFTTEAVKEVADIEALRG
ncbi:metallopeptidase family M24 [Plectosphaerella plurivora]|uniref:Xaa-Pro aminopeptidase n=1 Tax=Plectosphaerella plurivora TaxID=936078 RepID=A0A9P8VEY5_9PEZI|nr:metallopeptidase family M24 [Plectosphaerella plurivora]